MWRLNQGRAMMGTGELWAVPNLAFSFHAPLKPGCKGAWLLLAHSLPGSLPPASQVVTVAFCPVTWPRLACLLLGGSSCLPCFSPVLPRLQLGLCALLRGDRRVERTRLVSERQGGFGRRCCLLGPYGNCKLPVLVFILNGIVVLVIVSFSLLWLNQIHV